jgi:hypothetical protein
VAGRPAYPLGFQRQAVMWLGLAILLAVIYVIALIVVHTVPFFIHLIIIFAVISLVIHLISGGKK